MKKYIVFSVLIITLLCASKTSAYTEKHYYKRYMFNSPIDSSFFAYQMDYIVGNRTENTQRVYSLMCRGQKSWANPEYVDIRKTNKTIELKKYDGNYAVYLSADTDSLLIWSDPFKPIVQKYIGQTEFLLNGKPQSGYIFEMYYYLCTNKTSFVPTPFYQVRDENMELLYSKAPGVYELNIPWGMEVSNLEQYFSPDNWCYESNPIESIIRINKSMVPRSVRKSLEKKIKSMKIKRTMSKIALLK